MIFNFCLLISSNQVCFDDMTEVNNSIWKVATIIPKPTKTPNTDVYYKLATHQMLEAERTFHSSISNVMGHPEKYILKYLDSNEATIYKEFIAKNETRFLVIIRNTDQICILKITEKTVIEHTEVFLTDDPKIVLIKMGQALTRSNVTPFQLKLAQEYLHNFCENETNDAPMPLIIIIVSCVLGFFLLFVVYLLYKWIMLRNEKKSLFMVSQATHENEYDSYAYYHRI